MNNCEVVLFSGDFIEFITPIVTVIAVFLTYYLTKKEFKFKTYHERKIEVLCELYGMLEELKFLIIKTVFNSDEDAMTKNLEQSNEIYQKFNLLNRKISIFINDDLFEDIRKFEGEWLEIYAKVKAALREKKSLGNKGWGRQYDDALNKIVSDDLEKVLVKINSVVKKSLN